MDFLSTAIEHQRPIVFKSMRYFALILTLMMGFFQFNYAQAKQWKENFPQTQLLGQGEFRWFGFHIYTAKLWSSHHKFLQDQSFALELTYKKSISKSRFTDSSIDEIKRIYKDKYSEEKLREWRNYMDIAFIDVNAEDQLIGVYLPHIGCRFYSKDRLLLEVKDIEFAQAFFAIWLHPKTRDDQLRKKLLGGDN
jgi:hypothetical protein